VRTGVANSQATLKNEGDIPFILHVAGGLAFLAIRLIQPAPFSGGSKPRSTRFPTAFNPVTDFSMRLGFHGLVTFLPLELFWVQLAAIHLGGQYDPQRYEPKGKLLTFNTFNLGT